jgi:hypothetical protein
VALDVGGVAEQGGDRRPQLVGGVRHEPLLALARGLERRQHPVQGLGEPLHLVAGAGRGQAFVAGSAAADLVRGGRQRRQGPHRSAGQKPGGEDTRQHPEQRRDQRHAAHVGQVLVDVGEIGRHDDRAGISPRHRRERCDVDPQVAATGGAARELRPAGAVGARDEVVRRHDPAAERQRAVEQPALAVQQLHQQRAPVDGAVERAGRIEQLRRRRLQRRQLGGAGAEPVVDRLAQRPAHQHELAGADDGRGDRDADRRRDGDPGAEAARSRDHDRSSVKPTPRTVWTIAGGPSFRRR